MDWFLYDNGLRHERVKACPNTDKSFDLIKEHCMDNSYSCVKTVYFDLHRRRINVYGM